MAEPIPARVVSDEDKKLAADYLKRIEEALGLRKDEFARFEKNRKWLRGICPSTGAKLRTNLHFANLAAMRPQVYAKDPEFSIQPTKAVPEDQIDAIRGFAETAEALLEQLLIRDAKLKKRAKRLLTSCYTTALGWWKACWQENPKTDPLIQQRIKDTQDNIDRLQVQQEKAADPATDSAMELAKLREMLAGLESQAEVSVAKGVTLDFVLPEDIVCLDSSVREITDYERASAMAHAVWMTRDRYRSAFGYDPQKGKAYREQAGQMQASTEGQKGAQLLRVWEIWDQDSNRVFTVCEGEEGFCKAPYSPDWTGERWLPFFLLAFNEIDGSYLPLSDVELTEEVVKEYNRTRDDFERDRKGALPVNVVRKGGQLTPDDLDKIKNRQGSDIIVVEGNGGNTPLTNDIFSGQLSQIKPENYDTSAARQDMEMLVGGGDAARGAVLKAKTATEAEILAQGMRGRSAERTDIIEDLLSDVGKYVLEMCLRKLTEEEVKRIAGPKSFWPSLSADQVFEMVSVSVRGGSTGKPDRLQEQDRWTKLLPVIEKAMAQVAQLRQAGQEGEAQAVIALVKETLRRFDERMDLEQFLPTVKEGEQNGPQITPAMVEQAKTMIDELHSKVAELEQAMADKSQQMAADVEKARITAQASVQAAVETAQISAAATIEVARIGSESRQEIAESASMELAEPTQNEPFEA